MKDILVLLDKPKHEQIALQRALELSEKTGARLHLVSFIYEDLLNMPGFQQAGEDLVNDLRRGRERWQDELCTGHGLGSNVQTDAIWHHSIVEWVMQHLARHNYGVVIKTAQKQFGGGGFGSIDWQLIERSSVPLWLAVETPWVKRNRIVISLDPRLDSPEHSGLNERVLTAGGDIGTALGARLDAISTLVYSPLLQELGFSKSAPERDAQALREHLLANVAASGVECDDLKLPTGKPAREVNRLVDKYKARLMLVGRGVRKGAGGILLGNTAERILSKANSDVMVVP